MPWVHWPWRLCWWTWWIWVRRFLCSTYITIWAMEGSRKSSSSSIFRRMFTISFKWVEELMSFLPFVSDFEVWPSTSSFIQNPVRWLTPKSPSFKIDEHVPTLLDAVLKYFLPMGLSIEQRESERQGIHRFVRELNQIRKSHIDRDFANSYVVNNVSALAESYPFVSIDIIADALNHITAARTKVSIFTMNSLLASNLRSVWNFSWTGWICCRLIGVGRLSCGVRATCEHCETCCSRTPIASFTTPCCCCLP